MRIVSFVGTRPEIIKTLAFCRAAPLFPNLDFLVIHTGQNFGQDMADGFLQELNIPLADQKKDFDRTTVGSTAKSLLDYCLACIDKYRPDVILSNTDTNTAFYCALAATHRKVRVAHVEGGIRCEARLNPEEINRRLSDHLSSWVFTISDEDTQTLRQEGFPAEAIYMLGDITLDALRIVLRENNVEVKRGDYNVLTTHRQENANNPERLTVIIDAVEAAGFPTVFPVHPRTRGTLEQSGLWRRLQSSQVITARPAEGSYVKMVKLLAGCNKLISDSGGTRREGYMLDKPVISLVSFVWFHQMNRLGYEVSADADRAKIVEAIRSFDPPGPRPPIFGDGHAAEHILRTLVNQS